MILDLISITLAYINSDGRSINGTRHNMKPKQFLKS